MRRTAPLAVVIAATLLAFVLGVALHPTRESKQPALATQVRAELATHYYRALPREVLARRSVDALLAGLHDPYTHYLSPGEFRLAQRATHEGYSGVGLTLLPGERGLVVTRTPPGPARLAGIRPGDTILAVDGRSVAGLRFTEALGWIVGREGSRVELRVRRGDHTATFSLVRRRFLQPSVHVRLLPDGIGLVRVDRFAVDTSRRSRSGVRILEEAGARGLVLDLRGNPGGLLTQAVGLASLFLEEGATIASLSGAHRDDRLLFARAGEKNRLPLVVLVDAGSASAAEIVAAALHDHGRAVLVGDATFGKTLVQEVEPLPNGGALKLTVASYRTPAGRDISRGGVRPDIRSADGLAIARRLLNGLT